MHQITEVDYYWDSCMVLVGVKHMKLVELTEMNELIQMTPQAIELAEKKTSFLNVYSQLNGAHAGGEVNHG